MNPPNQNPMPYIPLPPREHLSEQQVNTVLNIIRDLQPYLLLTQREIDMGIPREVDGGVTSSAEVTFIKACDRLDSMLNDMSRWNMKQSDELHTAITNHFNTSTKVGEKQIETINQMQRPSRHFKPTLTTIAGEFIAFWGDAKLPGGMILGRGKTPGLAVEDFDKAFAREASEQLRFAAASEERLAKEEETPMQPEENKKRKKRKPRKGY